MPIKKWGDFTVFDKNHYEEQIRRVTQSNLDKIQIDPENFLVRIPKYFFWKSTDEQIRDSEIYKNGKANLMDKMLVNSEAELTNQL